MHIPRSYDLLAFGQLMEDRQMFFLSGPRQVGKTTSCRRLGGRVEASHYFDWEGRTDRAVIRGGAAALGEEIGMERLQDSSPLLILDEIHKFAGWKDMLKGLFDAYADQVKVIVTGSARMDVFKRGGDSLLGRYFPYRMHPLSVAELASVAVPDTEIRRPPKTPSPDDFRALLEFGGFPEPYLRREKRFHRKWLRLRTGLLLKEDLRDLSRTTEVARIEVLAQLVAQRAGQLTSYASLSKELGVSIGTVKRWLTMLEALYYLFPVRPWYRNVARALRKEPKYYLWDWSALDNDGARLENLVASALLKAVHFWSDTGMGDYALHYIRDKEKREVDFLVVRDNSPWFLVEVKKAAGARLSKDLFRFQEQTGASLAFQVAADLDPVDADCFSIERPTIVPMVSFLSQLV